MTIIFERMKKYALNTPKLADWMEVNVTEGLTIFSFPRAYQKRLRTSNYLERFNQGIKRRPGLFVCSLMGDHACG